MARYGVPLAADGRPARLAIIGYGALGASELNYAPQLELFFLSDPVQSIQGGRGAVIPDYFDRVAKRVLQWLSDVSIPSAQYTVDSELRPPSSRESLVSPIDGAVRYYENQGQSWQRLAFIKARGVAGDLTLATEFLEQLEPWIYRRYLSRSDITEIAALKRQLEKRVQDAPLDAGSLTARAGGYQRHQVLDSILAVAQRW